MKEDLVGEDDYFSLFTRHGLGQNVLSSDELLKLERFIRECYIFLDKTGCRASAFWMQAQLQWIHKERVARGLPEP